MPLSKIFGLNKDKTRIAVLYKYGKNLTIQSEPIILNNSIWHVLLRENVGFNNYVRRNYKYIISEEGSCIGSTPWEYLQDKAMNELSEKDIEKWYEEYNIKS